jgi:hypothetical protein
MASNTSEAEQVPTASSPRIDGGTPRAAVKSLPNIAAPPATAHSPAGPAQQALRTQLKKGQPSNLQPPDTAASPPWPWLTHPAKKTAP